MMECDLAPDFYTWTEPVARKQHRCVECRAPILKGEKHFRYAGKWEGDLSTGRQHLECMEACMLLRDKFGGGDSCVAFGDLKPDFREVDEYFERENDGKKPAWIRLRHLMAVILWRERAAKRTLRTE